MRVFAIFVATIATVSAFQLDQPKLQTPSVRGIEGSSRLEFVQQLAVVSGAAVLLTPLQPAHARGRATLQYAYDRYSPRILAGGEFYKKDLSALIQKQNWQGIKDAVAEPPKKTKEDRSKADGGVAERAAKAGDFSDSRVLVACDLYAGTFSDNSVSEKTKNMKKEVEELRAVVQGMELTAKQALGEDTGGGGLLGFGAKKPSKAECANKLKELYIQGGTVWNRYIFYANEGLPVQLTKFPFL
jgi:hypothetical protein